MSKFSLIDVPNPLAQCLSSEEGIDEAEAVQRAELAVAALAPAINSEIERLVAALEQETVRGGPPASLHALADDLVGMVDSSEAPELSAHLNTLCERLADAAAERMGDDPTITAYVVGVGRLYRLGGEEGSRVNELYQTQVMDTAPEPLFDDVVKELAAASGAPIALVSLLDDRRQWFKAKHGTDLSETPREIAFCDTVVRSGQPLWVEDASLHPDFVANPLVVGAPHIRFYAGVPITLKSERTMGTVCAIDSRPHPFDPALLAEMRSLAAAVGAELEARLAASQAEHSASASDVDP